MKFYETNNSTKALFITAFVIISLFVLTSSSDKIEESNEDINSSFSREALIEEIKCHDFKYPELILAQAVLESGHFKSSVFKENNNAFGMRFPKIRQTLAKKSNLNHAVYDNWKECVEDRMIYEKLYLNDKSRVEYKKYLDRVYAKGKNYSKKLETLIKQNNLKSYFEEN